MALLAGLDLFSDFGEGTTVEHVLGEGAILFVAFLAPRSWRGGSS